MLKQLRAQVNAALSGIPVRRKPALRRSDAPDALLATDLPLAADDASVAAFMEYMKAQSWRIRHDHNDWLLLDAPVPSPQADAPHMPVGECGCCISLLQRHPDGGDAQELIRAVVKAAEAGRQPFERLCARLHGQLAARLRLRQPLPSALLPYLYYAYHNLYDRRKAP